MSTSKLFTISNLKYKPRFPLHASESSIKTYKSGLGGRDCNSSIFTFDNYTIPENDPESG